MHKPSLDSDMADVENVQRVVGIAIDSSEDSTVAVNWAVQNHLRPGDAVILVYVRPTSVFTTIKASDQAKPLLEANIPFTIHTVKQRLSLEVERLGLSVLITALHGSEIDNCACPCVLLRLNNDKGSNGGKEELEYQDRKGKKRIKNEMSEAERERDVERVSDVHSGESRLIVTTPSLLLVWNLKGNPSDHSRPRDETSTRPCVEPVLWNIIDFKSKDLPHGMGVMALGKNEFYMFGGIVRSQKLDPYTLRTRFERDMMKTIYELTLDNAPMLRPAKLNEPMSPKYRPRVEVANGKAYVLQDLTCLSTDEIPCPVFEVYDIASKAWNKLPTIPTQESWSPVDQAIIKSGHHCASLLVGDRLYIMFGKLGKSNILGCFNTKSYMWEDKTAIRLQTHLVKARIFFPDMGTCVSRIDDLDEGLNIILLYSNETMFAYIIDDLGNLLCFQLVEGLSLGYEDMREVSLVDLNGGGRMCLVTSEERYAVLIRRFEIKLRDECKEKVKKLHNVASARGCLDFSDDLSGADPVEMEFLTVGNITIQRCPHTSEEHVLIHPGSAFFL